MAALNAVKSTVSSLIKSRILMSGPIPIADYMRMALTLPMPSSNTNSQNNIEIGSGKELIGPRTGGGYYMKKDVFGQHGDFITSPEISQMFGEVCDRLIQ